MIDLIVQIPPVIQALFGTLFTWGMTALGALTVFLRRYLDRKLLDWMMGFAGGVMIATSYWSLLAPAISIAMEQDLPAWLPPTIGFLLGGIALRGIDKVLPHLHIRAPIEQAEGAKTTWQRTVLLILAITLHNIPEGLVVGVTFGAAALNLQNATLAGAMIFVVVEDMVPESPREGNIDLATIGVLSGFAILMVLDVAPG